MSLQAEPKQMLKALKPFRYGRKDLTVGDSFKADSSHARLLKALGRAADEDARPAKAANADCDAPVTVKKATSKKSANKKPANKKPASKKATKGKYNRRDLQAEG